MSRLECWTRYNNRGNPYTTCKENGKQLRGGEPRRRNTTSVGMPRRNNTDRLRQLAIERDNMMNTERLMEQREERELDEFLDLDNFDSFLQQAHQQTEDIGRERERQNREQFLRRDRRNTFIQMTEQDDRDSRREAFTRTLSRPTEFMGRTTKREQTPVFRGNPLADDTPVLRKSGSGYAGERPQSQLLREGYLESLALPKRNIKRGNKGQLKGDGSMDEFRYLLKDMTDNPNKYKGDYGKKIKEHLNQYNTAYYYGLRRQQFGYKNQKKWNESSNQMKNLLDNI